MKKIHLKLSQLIQKTPQERDQALWGENSRRDFLKKSILASLGAVAGANYVFANKIPEGYIPLIFEENNETKVPLGKHKELVVLNDKPWNVETPPHLLDQDFTSADRMFIRNNGLLPEVMDESSWSLKISGESVISEKTFSLSDLKKFPEVSLNVTLECAGNGRHEFNPPAKGNQWTTGAVSFAKWTGVRLSDVLKDAGIKSNAVYIGYYGRDKHLSKNRDKHSISRGVPISKAMSGNVILAYKMNDEPIPIFHGQPVRLISPGYPASASGKWVKEIVVRNIVHDGTKMLTGYRVPKEPVSPGTKVPYEEMKIIESMPIKSIITYPKTGAMLKGRTTLSLRGKSWAGEQKVKEMYISIDFGSTWKKCELESSKNIGAWQNWKTKVNFPSKGYYEVWAKAIDENGIGQTMLVPGWNPKGYLNNACHRIAIKVL